MDLVLLIGFGFLDKEMRKRLFSFVPHSMAAGGLIAEENSDLLDNFDLKNKKIGVGGQVDKGWLIFRAFYKKKYGKDLIELSRPIFGAPPLLNKKIEQKDFDAILTYWPYQAKLLAKGNFKKVMGMKMIFFQSRILGMPVIGWVLKKNGQKNEALFKRFLETSEEAKE